MNEMNETNVAAEPTFEEPVQLEYAHGLELKSITEKYDSRRWKYLTKDQVMKYFSEHVKNPIKDHEGNIKSVADHERLLDTLDRLNSAFKDLVQDARRSSYPAQGEREKARRLRRMKA